VSDQPGEAIGVAVARPNAPVEGSASVPFLAIAPPRRFRGLGGEAALALERHLRHRFAIERLLAPVPDGRGLAVYFWLRLGYRPLLSSQAPWPLVSLSAEAKPGILLARD
jgi:GNAT superfamily N-acetyltransferase